jgi:hypothetical protein
MMGAYGEDGISDKANVKLKRVIPRKANARSPGKTFILSLLLTFWNKYMIDD